MRWLLLLLALTTAVAAGVKARRGAGGVLAFAGGAMGAALCVWAAGVMDASPVGACVLLHYEATVVARTLALGRLRGFRMPVLRGVAYLAVFPGLDARRAFVPDPSVRRGAGFVRALLGAAEIAAAFALVAAGDQFGWIAAGAYPAALVRGIGLLGLLDGLSRASVGALRVLGTDADESFQSPWLARDLGEFWGVRWNRFVGRTLHHEVFLPWARTMGVALASLLAFQASGLLHEVVYAAPADGPHGHYLVFFALQWLGVLVSSRIHSPPLRRAFLWTWVLATLPIFFEEPFPTAFPMERLFR